MENAGISWNRSYAALAAEGISATVMTDGRVGQEPGR